MPTPSPSSSQIMEALGRIVDRHKAQRQRNLERLNAARSLLDRQLILGPDPYLSTMRSTSTTSSQSFPEASNEPHHNESGTAGLPIRTTHGGDFGVSIRDVIREKSRRYRR